MQECNVCSEMTKAKDKEVPFFAILVCPQFFRVAVAFEIHSCYFLIILELESTLTICRCSKKIHHGLDFQCRFGHCRALFTLSVAAFVTVSLFINWCWPDTENKADLRVGISLVADSEYLTLKSQSPSCAIRGEQPDVRLSDRCQ